MSKTVVRKRAALAAVSEASQMVHKKPRTPRATAPHGAPSLCCFVPLAVGFWRKRMEHLYPDRPWHIEHLWESNAVFYSHLLQRNGVDEHGAIISLPIQLNGRECELIVEVWREESGHYWATVLNEGPPVPYCGQFSKVLAASLQERSRSAGMSAPEDDSNMAVQPRSSRSRPVHR